MILKILLKHFIHLYQLHLSKINVLLIIKQ